MIDIDARGRREAALLRDEAARIADTEAALQSVLAGEVVVELVTLPAQPSGGVRLGSRRRRLELLVGVAAAVVVVAAVVGALVLVLRDESDERRIPAAPPTTAAPGTAAAEAVAIAGGILNWRWDDPERAMSHLTDDLIAEASGTRENYRLEGAMLAALGEKHVNIRCGVQDESIGGVVVRCSFDTHTFRSEQLGRPPFTGGFETTTVRDGTIVAYGDSEDPDGATSHFGQMWAKFRRWVTAEHPDDVAVMYEGNGWRLTPESIALWERYTLEWAERSKPLAFIGLPPEGATPSTPERGELVAEFWGPLAGRPVGPQSHVVVYADGRLIWERQSAVPEGANFRETGWLEQRLTPEGVELVRSEILSTGLFDRNLDFDLDFPCISQIAVRNRGSLVRVNFGACGGEPPTQDQTDAVLRLGARLYDLASWLPASAWEDRTIRGYVPSRYQVCLHGPHEAPSLRVVGSLLPARAVEAVEALVELVLRFDDEQSVGPETTAEQSVGPRTTAVPCTDLTTEEARALAGALDDARHEQVANPYSLEYRIEADGQTGNLLFQPYLPHGGFGSLGGG